jgi:creatinine amidohydrolase
VETALLLSGAPELVRTEQYTTNYIADINQPAVLKPEFSGANFAWLTRDIAESGVMGDPTPATAENGEKWIAAAAAKVAEALTAMYRYEKRIS